MERGTYHSTTSTIDPTPMVSLDEFFNQFVGKEIIFEAANKYGLSTKGCTTPSSSFVLRLPGQSSDQLVNNRHDNDRFHVHPGKERGAYKFESVSVPGYYIGVDRRNLSSSSPPYQRNGSHNFMVFFGKVVFLLINVLSNNK